MRILAGVMQDVLRILKPIYRKNYYLPLTRIKLDVEDGTLLATASNGEIWMTTDAGYQSRGGTFIAVIDPRDLEPLIANEHHFDHLTFTPNPDAIDLLDIKGSTWASSIPTFSPDDFPATPKVSAYSLFQLGSADWKELALTAMTNAAPDDSRPVLGCVNFEAKSGRVVVTGADGFRLSTTDLTRTHRPFDSFLLPVPSLKRLPKTVQTVRVRREDAASDYVGLEIRTLRSRDRQTLDWDVIMRVMDGTFPDYPQIIPGPEKRVGTVTIPLWVIQAAAKNKLASVLRVQPGHAEIGLPTGKPQQWASSAIVFHSDPGYELFHAAFNPRYLFDLAAALGNPGAVTLSISTDHAAQATNGTTTAVVMGMVIGTVGEYFRTVSDEQEAA